MNPPNIVEGQVYYPHLVVPNLDYNKTKSWYELLIPAGGKTFTPDPVIKFATWAHNADGSQINPPLVVDKNKNPVTVSIGNGSTIAVQWARKEYGKMQKIVRPQLQAVQILELIERGESATAAPVSVEALAF